MGDTLKFAGAKTAMKTVFRRRKGIEKLNESQTAGSLATDTSVPPADIEGRNTDAVEKEKDTSMGVYQMPMGGSGPPRAPTTNVDPIAKTNTSDTLHPTTTTDYIAGTTNLNGQLPRTDNWHDPNLTRPDRGGDKQKGGQTLEDRVTHITQVHYISRKVQEIQSFETDPYEDAENNRDGHPVSDEDETYEEAEGEADEEDDMRKAPQGTSLRPRHQVSKGKYEDLEREIEALHRKCASLEKERNWVSGDEFTRLTHERSKLADQNQVFQNRIQVLEERDTKATANNQTLWNQNVELNQERDNWKDLYTSLSNTYDMEKENGNALATSLETKQAALEQLQTSNTVLMADKAENERRNRELHDQVNDVKGQLKASQEESKRLAKRNKLLSAQLAGYQFEGSIYSDDLYFQHEWNNLDAKILNWSTRNFAGALKSTQKLADGHILHRVATDPRRYLTSTERRPSFVQSFVWSVLVEQIFTPPGSGANSDLCGLYWSGHMRPELDYLSICLFPDPAVAKDQRVPDVEMRKFMKWKAATTQLVLEKINGDSDKEPQVYDELLEGLSAIILGCLEPYITSKDYPSCCKSLNNILKAAVKLDGKLNQQLARIIPQYTWSEHRTNFFHNFPLDTRVMRLPQGESVHGSDPKVQMVVTPALVRYGSIEGEKYENFQKPEVVLHAVVHLQSTSGFKKLTKFPNDNWSDGQPRNGEHSFSQRGIGWNRN